MKKYKVRLSLLPLLLIICVEAGCLRRDSAEFTDGQSIKMGQDIVRERPETEEIRVDKESDAINISQGNYAFEQLEDEEKIVYNEIVVTILEQRKGVDLSTKDTEVMKKVYSAVDADYGSLFWVEGYSFTKYTKDDELISLHFIPNYTMTKAERKVMQDRIDTVVNEWLSGISFTDSDYAKVKYVFETLIRKTDYAVASENNQNIISVFLNGETVCQGYACATQYLLKQLGIESTIVTGRANNESHAWNLVKLDGEYYYLDTTWGNSTYLDEESKEEKFVNYNYLGITSRELLFTHKPEVDFFLPECRSIQNNYYVREGLFFDSWQPDQIGAVYEKAWLTMENGVAEENAMAEENVMAEENAMAEENGVAERIAMNKNVSVKFAAADIYQQAVEYFIHQKKIYELCSGLEQFFYIENDKLNVLTISFD